MISAEYARTMARYNAWQNRSLYREADALTDAQRREDRGAFFKSLHATLTHILWGDTMWMSRFDGWDKPPAGAAKGENWLDWQALKAARLDADSRIKDWTARLTDADLTGDFSWHSAILKKDVTNPKWVLVTHLFNHQTHHRGQVHCLLTAMGRKPDDTDLGFMPDNV